MRLWSRVLTSPITLFVIGGAILAIPFARFGVFAYGYDSGLYRRYVLQPFNSFPNTPVPGLDHTVFVPRFLLDSVRFFVQNPDATLYGSYLLLGVVGLISMFYFAKHYIGNSAAVVAGYLYVASAIQFSAQHAFFFKQAVALPLFLFGILAFEKKQYALAALLGVLIVLTHQTTSILFLVIAAAGFVLRSLKERHVSIPYAFAATVFAAAYLLLHPHVASKLASPPVGIFLSQTEYILWSLPVLLLTAFGYKRLVLLVKEKPVFLGALVVGGSFVAFHLPFYSRVYPFLDMFLVIPAALGVLVVYKWAQHTHKRQTLLAMFMLGVVTTLPILHLQAAQEPSLTRDLQKTVLGLSQLSKHSSIITSPNLTPWAMGWSEAAVYTPGIFKEPHPLTEWSLYWSHADAGYERAFLESFPNEVFILARSQEQEYIPLCKSEVERYLYKVQPCL